ncbi:MAG: hypothetical protein EZS28_037681 [Streblomastix strix]|uniref:EF-hand domain-containing protein n=1 Tax=Streblomastix strix TaxID=222440 RepID=A0A5J4UA65_9EUKA|nr:MAG: hypothetical protein EZS28_037681 [Streblomastix strix]
MHREQLSDQELLELFNIADHDNSGTIDHDELVALLEQVGFSKGDEVEEIVNTIDKDGNGDIDSMEFIAGFQKKFDYNAYKLKSAFTFFSNGTPNGLIKTDQLIDALFLYGDLGKSKQQIAQSLRVMIPENMKELPDEINYNEFVDIMINQ